MRSGQCCLQALRAHSPPGVQSSPQNPGPEEQEGQRGCSRLTILHLGQERTSLCLEDAGGGSRELQRQELHGALTSWLADHIPHRIASHPTPTANLRQQGSSNTSQWQQGKPKCSVTRPVTISAL